MLMIDGFEIKQYPLLYISLFKTKVVFEFNTIIDFVYFELILVLNKLFKNLKNI